MQSLTFLRRATRRYALQPLGINADQVRGFASQAQLAGMDAAILALPFQAGGDDQPLQDAATGAPLFMVGVSPVGSSDPIGGA